MRVALFCLVLATAAVCGSASPFSDTTARSIQSALGQLGDSSHPEVSAVRKGFGLMTAPDCSQGTPCYQCALAMVDAIKPYQQANCDSAPSFSASNSSAVRDAYCSGNCYRAAVKLFRVFQVDPCLSYIRSTSSAASNLDFSFISNLLEYACVKNPVDGSYCSLTFASLGSGSSMSFIGGVNSTGCAALSDLGCCFQSTLDLINSTSFGALSYGITFNKVTDVYKNLCQLQGTPACPVLGVPTTQIKGTLVLRNLLFSYITDVTRAFVRRTIARAIYQSIISQNANLPITPASVQVTGFAQTTLPATTFQPTTVNQGVSVAFYVESPDDTYATSQLLAPVQAALANPDVTPLNVLPASAKVDNTASFSADTSASSATTQTTQDFSPASALVPTSLSLILGVVGLVAVVMH